MSVKSQKNSVYRWPVVHQKTGLSRTTVWRLTRDGQFPRHVQLSSKAVGWRADEVDAWIETRARVSSAAGGLA